MEKLIKLIQEAGAPYSLEQGGKHTKLRINGKLVQVLSRGSGGRDRPGSREWHNAIARVRRTLRSMGYVQGSQGCHCGDRELR